MKQRFDLIAVSLLFVTATFAVCLSIDPKGFSISQWQPLMAALIALAAAGLAYHGAMAKVALDREESTRRRAIERLGVLLRFRAAATQIGTRAQFLLKHLQSLESEWRDSIEVDPASLMIEVPDEIQEAWKNLHMFPLGAIDSIELLYRLMATARATVAARCDSNTKYRISFPRRAFGDIRFKKMDDDLRHLAEQYDWFHAASIHINRAIQSVIDETTGLQ